MPKQAIRRENALRNVLIFTGLSWGLPWLGWLVDQQQGITSQQESLGWLLLLVTPLLASILLRIFGGGGWKDAGLLPNFRANGKWYLFALLFHPLVTAGILLLGWGLGMIQVADGSWAKLGGVGQVVLLGVGANLVKNIFEEFGWRGYVAPKMHMVVRNDLVAYLLTGVVWFGWHLPYYLVLLPKAEIASLTALPLGTFVALALPSLLAASLVYGEVRLRTCSVWPAVLLHLGGNVLIGALITEAFFKVAPQWEWLISPGWSGLISILVFGLVGLGLYRTRMGKIHEAREVLSYATKREVS